MKHICPLALEYMKDKSDKDLQSFIDCLGDEKIVGAAKHLLEKRKKPKKKVKTAEEKFDEMDANGNGRLTKKEAIDFFNKDKD